ncbi:ATP-binding protein [Parafrankia sp. FMc2]|uniref:ATP-binding protein n=1 Tax=Parafrankia sp. FMc2 TaxID=3233196 RepID=UPI0034D65EDC
MSGSATSTLANAATTAAYLAICLSIARGLWRSGQWRNNPLGLATAAIFFTCAIGHGSHIFHDPHGTSHSGHGTGGGTGLGGTVTSTGTSTSTGTGVSAEPGLIDIHFLATGWDVLTATVGVWYWTLRGRFPALVRGAALFEDLRLREATQRTLRESEERYREIVETTSDGVVLLSATGEITYCNTQFAALVGGPAPGTPFVDLVLDVDRAEALDALHAIRGGVARRLEVRLRHSEARKVCAQVALTARVSPSGAVDGTLVIVTDITEQKNIEAQLRQAQRLDALGQLAGGIAHDFNNLLTVIDGYATLVLARGDLDGGVRQDLTAVRDAAARATGLTSQLLAFSRTSDVRPGPVDLNDLVRGLEAMLRRLIREDIDLVVILSPRPAVVRIDRGKLEQVLVNLVVNSRDAMPEGGRLLIRVDLLDETTPAYGFTMPRGTLTQPFVRLTVADTGHGMPDDVRARIFEPFFTTKPPGSGTGLGLATVYGIVRQAEGTVGVDSVPGLGATFRVDLPASSHTRPDSPAGGPPSVGAATAGLTGIVGAARAVGTARAVGPVGAVGAVGATGATGSASDAAETAGSGVPGRAGGAAGQLAAGASDGSVAGRRPAHPQEITPTWPLCHDDRRPGRGRATILLAEDDDAVRELAERVLRAAGHLVVCAADGRMAIDLARGLTSVDLLVTDVILPGRNGRQLAEELTRMFPGLPVVFTSAYSRGMLAGHGASLGVGYLPKPFTPDALAEAVRVALDAPDPLNALDRRDPPDHPDPRDRPDRPDPPDPQDGRRPSSSLQPGPAAGFPAARIPPIRLPGTPPGRHRERRARRGP